MKVGLLGTGSFGTAMAILAGHNAAARPGLELTWYARRPEVAKRLSAGLPPDRQGLENLEIPSTLSISDDLEAVVAGSTHLVFAVPSRFAEEYLAQIAPYTAPTTKVISLVKGVAVDAEAGTLQTPTQLIAEALNVPPSNVASLSGPNIYHEIVDNFRTVDPLHRACNTIISSLSEETSQQFRALYVTPNVLRVYIGTDPVGAEICGALKNVVALMAGIGDGAHAGRGMGVNFKASLLTRGAYEIAYFVRALGGKQETVYGLAGLGDMIATALAGRSYSAGRLIAALGEVEAVRKAMAPNEIEAFQTLERLSLFLNGLRSRNPNITLDLPIFEAIHDIVFSAVPVSEAVSRVINRTPKPEHRSDPLYRSHRPAGIALRCSGDGVSPRRSTNAEATSAVSRGSGPAFRGEPSTG